MRSSGRDFNKWGLTLTTQLWCIDRILTDSWLRSNQFDEINVAEALTVRDSVPAIESLAKYAEAVLGDDNFERDL
jgi:hypothetical protein